ncbi:MAG: hypothetical protein WB421_14765 [Terriglobales bacterium]
MNVKIVLAHFCVWSLYSVVLASAQSSAVKPDQAPAAKPARSSAKEKKQDRSTRHLQIVQTISSPSEIANAMRGSFKCDSDGDLYLQVGADPVPAILKLNPKGERISIFQASVNPDMKLDVTGEFALQSGGDLYEFAFPHEITRYVFAFKSDGSYKSAIKLQPGFPWAPSALAVFAHGEFLISGLEYDHDRTNPVMWPFNGIFSSDGRLLKEVKLEDDETLHDLAAAGDARVSSTTNPSHNQAIDFSKMEPAADGNIFLMRWMNPAIFYAVSPGGEVVRRFTVDPGDSSFQPVTMHVSGTRIAVLFTEPKTQEEVIKVVDLEGHEVETFDQPVVNGQPKYGRLGLGFACYTDYPERFTFLSTGDDDKLEFTIAEPQ